MPAVLERTLESRTPQEPKAREEEPVWHLRPPYHRVSAAPMPPRIQLPPATPSATLPFHLRDMLAVIGQRLYDQSLNVKTLRTACQISDHNISTEFKRYFGCSIKDYIESHRLTAAASIMASQELSVYEIAFAVGYSHIQTFHRAFVRRFQCTPGNYRERRYGLPAA